MMRLLSRSVLREIGPPFLLGFVAYTFILLVRTIYFLADFFVRRSASLGEVLWLVALSVPWIVVLTLPMAFLLGVLIGVGRMKGHGSGDLAQSAYATRRILRRRVLRRILGSGLRQGGGRRCKEQAGEERYDANE